MLVEMLIASWLTVNEPGDPGQPTKPPTLPTYVVRGDGTRVDCTPNFQHCWSER